MNIKNMERRLNDAFNSFNGVVGAVHKGLKPYIQFQYEIVNTNGNFYLVIKGQTKGLSIKRIVDNLLLAGKMDEKDFHFLIEYYKNTDNIIKR